MSIWHRVVHRRGSVMALFVLAGAASVLAWQSRPVRTEDSLLAVPSVSTPPVEKPQEPVSSVTTESASEMPAADAKPTVLGFWRDDFYGKRIFQFREDGTGTMVIELDAIGKAIYGPQLKFFLDWKIEDEVLKMKMTGGEPASAFSAAKLFGESSEQHIESLEENEMRLKSLDSGKLYKHRRVAGWD